MSNILEKIIETKKQEVAVMPSLTELMQELEEKITIPCRGFANALLQQHKKCFQESAKPAIISELKKASPSKGVIREQFNHIADAEAYEEAGATCLSVLTDKNYFQGDISYLREVSKAVKIPCLRKDFIIDEKQIVEARLNGADAILLIAAILDDQQMMALCLFAQELGLDVLIEVHDANQMQRALQLPTILIGVNNRNLRDFSVSLETTVELAKQFKIELIGKLLIAESGVNAREDLDYLLKNGAGAFLVGESLMRQDDLKAALEQLL